MWGSSGEAEKNNASQSTAASRPSSGHSRKAGMKKTGPTQPTAAKKNRDIGKKDISSTIIL